MIKLEYDEFEAWLVYETEHELLKIRMIKDRPSKEEALAAAIRFCKSEDEQWDDPIVQYTVFTAPVLSLVGAQTSQWCVYIKRIHVPITDFNLKQTEVYTRAITALEESMDNGKSSRFYNMCSALEAIKDSNTIELVTTSTK